MNELQDFVGTTHSDDEDYEKVVKELLLYHKVVKAEEVDGQTALLTLDNGTQLLLEGNEGCGGCGNGWFFLQDLNTCNNVITDVKCECDCEEGCDGGTYHIYVFAEDQKINLVEFNGYDNGWYGTGYRLSVKLAK